MCIRDRLKEAESLIDGINFRHATLYKVACCMVQMQVEFFEKGYDCLRPLTMAQVAEATGVSESTVSRVSNGNYMQTPRGVFELRFFFHASAYQGTDRVVSSISVKHRIGELVDCEDPSNPLSDQAISEALEREGVSVSRRTVNTVSYTHLDVYKRQLEMSTPKNVMNVTMTDTFTSVMATVRLKPARPAGTTARARRPTRGFVTTVRTKSAATNVRGYS